MIFGVHARKGFLCPCTPIDGTAVKIVTNKPPHVPGPVLESGIKKNNICSDWDHFNIRNRILFGAVLFTRDRSGNIFGGRNERVSDAWLESYSMSCGKFISHVSKGRGDA